MYKRIFLINQTDASYSYGIGKYISEITKAIKLQPNLYNLVIVTIGKPKIGQLENKKYKNITYFNIPTPYYYQKPIVSLSIEFSKAIFCILNDYFKFTEKDIFHFNNNIQYFLIREVKEKTSAKLVYTIHVSLWKVFFNNNFNKFIEIFNSEEGNSVHIRNIKAEIENCKLSDRVICLSDEMKEDLIHVYKISEKKIVIIPNGISDDTPILEDSNLRQKLQIKNNEFVILYVGRLNGQKGVTYVLEAALKIIREGRKEIRLIFVGEGNLKAELEKKAKIYKEKVFFTGYVQPDMIEAYYKLADMIVLSSLNEQSSYVMLEAMKYKIPIISTNIKAFQHLKEGVTSLKINLIKENTIDVEWLIKKIILLIENKALRDRIAENAYVLFQKKFTSKRMVDMTYKLPL